VTPLVLHDHPSSTNASRPGSCSPSSIWTTSRGSSRRSGRDPTGMWRCPVRHDAGPARRRRRDRRVEHDPALPRRSRGSRRPVRRDPASRARVDWALDAWSTQTRPRFWRSRRPACTTPGIRTRAGRPGRGRSRGPDGPPWPASRSHAGLGAPALGRRRGARPLHDRRLRRGAGAVAARTGCGRARALAADARLRETLCARPPSWPPRRRPAEGARHPGTLLCTAHGTAATEHEQASAARTARAGPGSGGASPARTARTRSSRSTTRMSARCAGSSPTAARSVRAASRARAAAIRTRSRTPSSVRARWRCSRTSSRARARAAVAVATAIATRDRDR